MFAAEAEQENQRLARSSFIAGAVDSTTPSIHIYQTSSVCLWNPLWHETLVRHCFAISSWYWAGWVGIDTWYWTGRVGIGTGWVGIQYLILVWLAFSTWYWFGWHSVLGTGSVGIQYLVLVGLVLVLDGLVSVLATDWVGIGTG